MTLLYLLSNPILPCHNCDPVHIVFVVVNCGALIVNASALFTIYLHIYVCKFVCG